jgi:hypothetical protein
MDLVKANTKRALEVTGRSAVPLLEAVVAASSTCPPPQSAAGGALHIAKLVQVTLVFSGNTYLD